MADAQLAAAGAGVEATTQEMTCEDCGEHVDALGEVVDRGVTYHVCESCWEHYQQTEERAEVDVGEQDDDFGAEDWVEDEEDEEAYVGSTAWWADGIADTVDTGAYALLMSSGAHW